MAPHEGFPHSSRREPMLADILEALNDAVVAVGEDYRIVFMNEAAEKMFGYDRGELTGRDSKPLIPPQYLKVYRRFVDQSLASGKVAVESGKEYEVLHKDGRRLSVEIAYSVSRTEDRRYLTAVLRDVGRRKELERERRFLERLADTGKAVAQVVHEIRKPLILIGGFARQLENCEPLSRDHKNSHKLRIITDEVGRLEKLLSGIGLLTRPPESSRKLPVQLNDLLEETCELLETLVQNQKVNLEMDLASEPLEVSGDPDQLKQVFLNLLQNALEATESGGAIRVHTRWGEGFARVVVEDEGAGIPPEIQEKIFDPFFTTKSQGTGLGLAISRNIVEDHGGHLILSSFPSQGTSFTIVLPLQEKERW